MMCWYTQHLKEDSLYEEGKLNRLNHSTDYCVRKRTTSIKKKVRRRGNSSIVYSLFRTKQMICNLSQAMIKIIPLKSQKTVTIDKVRSPPLGCNYPTYFLRFFKHGRSINQFLQLEG